MIKTIKVKYILSDKLTQTTTQIIPTTYKRTFKSAPN